MECCCEEEKPPEKYKNAPISEPGSGVEPVQDIPPTAVSGCNTVGAGANCETRESAEHCTRLAGLGDVNRYQPLPSRDGTVETAARNLYGTQEPDHSLRNHRTKKNWQRKMWRKVLFILLLISSVFGK